MAKEIERKFLVASEAWRPHVAQVLALRQGYLAAAPDRSIRVRIDRDTAWLTLKFGGAGLVREEFEYDIPVSDAEELMQSAIGIVLEKTRHKIEYRLYI